MTSLRLAAVFTLISSTTVMSAAGEATTLFQTLSASAGDARIEAALKQLHSHENSSRHWSQLGAVLAQKQRETETEAWYEYAESAFTEAHRLDPKNVEALTGLAWVWGGRHQFVQSVRWARAALDLDPANPEAHGILGDAALEFGDHDRALESYQQMIESRPDLSSYSRSAWLLWVMGRREQAVDLMRLAIGCGGPHAENTAWCRARLALMQRESGHAQEALITTQLGLRHCPGHRHLLIEKARVLVSLQRVDEALRIYEQALEKRQSKEVFLAMADLWETLKQPEKAVTLRQRAAALAEDSH